MELGFVRSSLVREERAIVEPPSLMITSLPDDVILDILARVPRCNYRTLSFVSKHFRSLVESLDIYERRSLLGCTEAFIYAVISNKDTEEYSLYIICRKGNINRFVLVQSLLHMPSNADFVAVGSKIYVLGEDTMTSRAALSIDCRSHTVQPLPNLPIPMGDLYIEGVLDGNFYITGYINDCWEKRIMMCFNTETQMWEPVITKADMVLDSLRSGSCVVENTWEKDEMMNLVGWRNTCFIDDVLYYYDYFEYKLRAYDTKHKCWGVVKGVGGLLPEGTYPWFSHTVSYGGKVGVFLPIVEEECWSLSGKETWFVEIAIERRQGGEIWGEVECCDVVLENNILLFEHFVVMV